MRAVNLETVTDMPSWYRTWPQWIQSFPCKTKTSQETKRSSRKFLEPSEKPTGIARSARGPKLPGLRAEDALAERYLELKILVI